ncbi:unnamed protein product, partial [Timema podura]|nr:unnamed protein product [Timema podura]
MRVLFRTNSQIPADGFKARWRTNCGGVITNKTFGHVMSPGYPVGYSDNLNCNYTFIFPEKHIQISFLSFDVEQAYKACQYDNVTVLAQQYFWTTTMTNLGTYCGNNIPPVIGQRNRIEVIFRTDRSIKKTGFMFQYEVETCGGNITEQRLIKSPVNNNRHNSRVRCNWLITAPVGKRVTLRFTSLKIEYHPACNYDYIEPYDDKTTSEKKRMGRYCGNLDSNPPTIHSTGRYLSLLFVTDGSSQGEGFLASVMFTTVCGGITNVSQQSQTLRYPASGKYATFLDCAWTLVAPLGQIVQLQITSLDLASCFNMSTASCDCDYLEVRDGVSQYSDLIGRFCGNTAPPAFTSTSNKMWVHFVSDGTENRNGFQAQVSSIASICGNSMLNVTSSLQELTSPNYPGNYPVNIRCRWLLSSGPVGNLWNNMNQIYIHFKELDLETGGDNCRNDRLQVSDIIECLPLNPPATLKECLPLNPPATLKECLPLNPPATLKECLPLNPPATLKECLPLQGFRQPTGKGTFCGHGEPLDYYSNSANVEIVFVSNFNVTARGFKIQYGLQGCNRNYTGVQGRIKLRPDAQDCIVTIQAQPNHTISLYFLEFYLMSDDICSNNFLEVS